MRPPAKNSIVRSLRSVLSGLRSGVPALDMGHPVVKRIVEQRGGLRHPSNEWRQRVLGRFRYIPKDATPKELHILNRKTAEYGMLLSSINEHEKALREAGWGLERDEKMKNINVARHCGLGMPKLYEEAVEAQVKVLEKSS